jgi:hypothetical protein
MINLNDNIQILGFKFYVLCGRNYYIYDFWLYEGEESERRYPNVPRSSSPQEIVLDFVIPLIMNGFSPYIVVTDSYYSSLSLAKTLHELNLGFIMSCQKVIFILNRSLIHD